MPTLLLVPVSFGPSSVALLHILDQQLQNQKSRTGRCSFQIHVLFVDQSTTVQQPHYHERWDLLRERFPSHCYSIAHLDDYFSRESHLGFQDFPLPSEGLEKPLSTKRQTLDGFLADLPSVASKADIIGLLRYRLANAFAKDRGCDAILYGDSTTRLAERTLSETAKGRGGALPWLTADGQSPHRVKIVYPMRDLLRKEIAAYTGMTNPPLTSLLFESSPRSGASISSKSTTIEELMGQYFESVEQNYPSIVANVVRTSSRLVAPSAKPGQERVCLICRLPLTKGLEESCWNGKQESPDQTTHKDSSETTASLCYGCVRSVSTT